jgi:hypothetical protein
MKIVIDNQQPVSLIREQFNRLFPYLKLEFYPKQQAQEQTAVPNGKEPWNKKIGELRQRENTGAIDVLPGMTVLELKHLFAAHYGLDVQVLRRFGRTWLETGKNDNHTLSALNSIGKKDSLFTEN